MQFFVCYPNHETRYFLELITLRFSLKVSFPPTYPSSPPSFELKAEAAEDGASTASAVALEPRLKLRVQKALERIAAGRIARGKLPLVTYCLRQVEGTLATSIGSTKVQESSSATAGTRTTSGGGGRNVPYPRTSGARFSQNGKFLVTFGRHFNQQMTVNSPNQMTLTSAVG